MTSGLQLEESQQQGNPLNEELGERLVELIMERPVTLNVGELITVAPYLCDHLYNTPGQQVRRLAELEVHKVEVEPDWDEEARVLHDWEANALTIQKNDQRLLISLNPKTRLPKSSTPRDIEDYNWQSGLSDEDEDALLKCNPDLVQIAEVDLYQTTVDSTDAMKNLGLTEKFVKPSVKNSRQKAWHDRAMHSHQRDPICVGDWVYHYQGKIKPIGHKFVPKWKGPYVVREVNLNSNVRLEEPNDPDAQHSTNINKLTKLRRNPPLLLPETDGQVSLGEPLPAIDEESESEKEREEEEAEVEAWRTEVHWEKSSDEDTGEMEVKMKLRDTYGKPEKEFDWHWIMRTPLHKYAQHQVNINQEITEYAIRGFHVEQRMLCFEGRETPVTEAKIRKAFDIPQVGGEVDSTREIPTDTKWLEPYLRTKDLGGTTHLSYGKKALAPGFQRRIVTLAHALDYEDGLQGVRLEVMWIFHHFHNEYPIDWILSPNYFSVGNQSGTSTVGMVRMNRRLWEEKPKEVPTEENTIRVSKSEPTVAFLTVFTIRENTTRMTAIASSSLLPLKAKKARCEGKNTDSAWFNDRKLGDDDGDGSKQGNHLILLNNKFFSKVFEFPNEGTTWEEHLARRMKTRGLQLSEFCAEVVAVLRPLSVIMGCRNNPKSVPVNVLWAFIAADRNWFMNWAMIFQGSFFQVVKTARKLMMKNNGGDTILYPFLAHMSTFLDLRVGDYYKFRPYRMLTDIPDHRTTMAFLKRVETEEDGLFRLLKLGEPTDRVVTGIEEEETDTGEEDGPAAGSGWGGLYIDTLSKEGVQLYFDETARTHPVPRLDTPPQIIQIIMTRKQQHGNPSTPTPRTVLMDWDCPRQQGEDRKSTSGAKGQESGRLRSRWFSSSATARYTPRSSHRVRAMEVTDTEQEHHQGGREEEVPADPWGGFAQEPEPEPAQVLLHPTDPNAEEEMGRHQVLERVPPAPLPENGQQEAVPNVRPMEVERLSSRQDETRKRARSPPHNGKGEHHKHRGDGEEEPRQEARPSRRQPYKDTAQILLTLAHEEEIGQKLEGRLRTMEEKVSQFEGHLIGVQKFIEEHHEQLLTAITNLSEREREELRQL
ncbi:hypothetical protein SELMODRAFT_425116 [Selaginella moellendorffii]|uniref:Uncharacterized protein n=1 Tax=Selaginella moellendorffii TaxID=88036 RepID=D8SS23_SELML|nr:hypothetical protein SELMODRAFT_425116 [Selaginella moellendorffii]